MIVLFAVVVALSTSLSTALISRQLQLGISSVSSISNNKGRRRINKECTESLRLYASTMAPDVIDSWKLMPDGRIKGVISPGGDNVLTSPLQNSNGLKEMATIQTASGSNYRLGTPDVVASATDKNNSSRSNNNRLSADRLGISRGNVRATRPIKVRATVPLLSTLSGSGNVGPNNRNKKNDFLTPLVGGASAVLIGVAIGTGVVNDKGISIGDIKVDPKEILKSSKMMSLPDIKFLKAPTIPSISLPQNIKLLPNLLDVSASEGIQNLGSGVTNAFNNAFGNSPLKSETKKSTSVGQGPYRVPMPYLDKKIVQAETERTAQVEADKKSESESEVRRAQIAEEEAARLREEIKQIRLTATKDQENRNEAASREAVIIDEVRKASVGAKSALKSTYTDESSTTFEGWQERQRERYGRRSVAVTPTYQNWKQIASTPRITSTSGEIVTAAAVTGAPVPISNQLVSGTTGLSKVAALSYVAIGSAVAVGGLGFAWQGDDEQQTNSEESSSIPETVQDSKIISTPTSDSTTLDSQLISDRVSSVTRAIPPRQSSLTSEFDAEPSNIKENSNIASASSDSSDPLNDTINDSPYLESQLVVADSQQTESSVVNGASYLESMTSNSGVKNDSGESLKSSYSPFYDLKSKTSTRTDSNLKRSYSPFGGIKPIAHTNDALYSAP